MSARLILVLVGLGVLFSWGCDVVVHPPSERTRDEPKPKPKKPKDPQDPKEPDPKEPKKPKKPPKEIPEEEVVSRKDCEPGPAAPFFRKIAETRNAWAGDCGELVWEEGKALFWALPDGEALQVSDDGHWLWFEGERLLFSEGGTVKLLEAGELQREWEVVAAVSGGALPHGESFWVCGQEGIVRLDEEGATALTSNFSMSGEPVDCTWIDAAPGGRIAYPTKDGRVGVVDASTGDAVELDYDFITMFGQDDQDRSRADVVALSPDGSLLFHELRWLERMGDAFGFVGEGELTVVDVATGEALRLPGMLADARQFISSSWRWVGPWMGSAPGVFLPDPFKLGKGGQLLGLGTPRTVMDLRAVVSRGNHVFMESEDGVSRLDLPTGETHFLADIGSPRQVIPQRWGGPIAMVHGPVDCIRDLETNVCHTQIWALSFWDPGDGAEIRIWSDQPPGVHALGPDGSMVLSGNLFFDKPPEYGEPPKPNPRVVVLNGAGRLVRDLDPMMGIEAGLGGAHFAILERSVWEEGVRTEHLVAIDWSTGAETLLVQGSFVDGWELDHTDRRLTAVVNAMDEEMTKELWSGVVGP